MMTIRLIKIKRKRGQMGKIKIIKMAKPKDLKRRKSAMTTKTIMMRTTSVLSKIRTEAHVLLKTSSKEKLQKKKPTKL